MKKNEGAALELTSKIKETMWEGMRMAYGN